MKPKSSQTPSAQRRSGQEGGQGVAAYWETGTLQVMEKPPVSLANVDGRMRKPWRTVNASLPLIPARVPAAFDKNTVELRDTGGKACTKVDSLRRWQVIGFNLSQY
jgi:hypothetical protein